MRGEQYIRRALAFLSIPAGSRAAQLVGVLLRGLYVDPETGEAPRPTNYDDEWALNVVETINELSIDPASLDTEATLRIEIDFSIPTVMLVLPSTPGTALLDQLGDIRLARNSEAAAELIGRYATRFVVHDTALKLYRPAQAAEITSIAHLMFPGGVRNLSDQSLAMSMLLISAIGSHELPDRGEKSETDGPYYHVFNGCEIQRDDETAADHYGDADAAMEFVAGLANSDPHAMACLRELMGCDEETVDDGGEEGEAQPTHGAFITQFMEYSRNGAMGQAFMLEALDGWSRQFIDQHAAAVEKYNSSSFPSHEKDDYLDEVLGTAPLHWLTRLACAQELVDAINAREDA